MILHRRWILSGIVVYLAVPNSCCWVGQWVALGSPEWCSIRATGDRCYRPLSWGLKLRRITIVFRSLQFWAFQAYRNNSPRAVRDVKNVTISIYFRINIGIYTYIYIYIQRRDTTLWWSSDRNGVSHRAPRKWERGCVKGNWPPYIYGSTQLGDYRITLPRRSSLYFARAKYPNCQPSYIVYYILLYIHIRIYSTYIVV